METLHTEHGYEIQFNGSSTYFIVDSSGQCLSAKDTERKAMNFLKKALKGAGF